MLSESFLLDRIQGLVLSDILDSEDRLDGVLVALDAAAAAWNARFQSYPPIAELRFVPSTEQEGLFLGLTPTDRRPGRLAVLLETLRSPDFTAWLGNAKIKSLEAGLQSSRDASGRIIEASYRVVVKDHKGRAFELTVPSAP